MLNTYSKLTASGCALFKKHYRTYTHLMGIDFGAGAFVVAMAVNGLTPSSVTVVPGGGPGGSFDFRYDFGRGSDKLKTGETVSWDAFGLGSSHLPINVYMCKTQASRLISVSLAKNHRPIRPP
ncbi:MAG: hypothetical protein LZF84_00305 [Nitrosomonas sp.]|nr:MAG: hypothetical protein LZF84_00305 [Nitrosomonas sp.]